MKTFRTMLVAVMVVGVSLGSALAGPGEGRAEKGNRAPAHPAKAQDPQAPPERHFPKAVQKERPQKKRALSKKPLGIVKYSPMLETFTIEEANLAFDVTKHVNTGLGNLTGDLSTKIDGVPFKLQPSLSFPASLEADLKSKMVPSDGNVPYLVEITIDMGDIEADGMLSISVANAINALDPLFWLWAISLTDTVESAADANQVTIHSTLFNATPASAIYKISGN